MCVAFSDKESKNTMKKETENSGKSDVLTRPPEVGDDHAEGTPKGVTLTRTPEDVLLTELRAENEQLKATIRLQQAHRQITGELAKAGARSPELLFDAIKAEMKFTADGKLENAKALIDNVTARFPEQFGFERPASIDAGAGTSSGNTLTREALAKMKPAEIARLDWDDVKSVLSGG